MGRGSAQETARGSKSHGSAPARLAHRVRASDDAPSCVSGGESPESGGGERVARTRRRCGRASETRTDASPLLQELPNGLEDQNFKPINSASNRGTHSTYWPACPRAPRMRVHIPDSWEQDIQSVRRVERTRLDRLIGSAPPRMANLEAAAAFGGVTSRGCAHNHL